MKKITPLLILVAFVLAWELYCDVTNFPKTILPAPSDIASAIVSNAGILAMHSMQTLEEALVGLFCAIVLGLGVATLLFHFPRVRAGVYPLLVLSQTIPVIALAPLLLIWFGFDLFPKVIIVVLYCFFPITVALSDALKTTDQNIVDLLKSMRASTFQVLKFVRLPAALPAFFSGLKIAVTYAITAAIVGEFVGGYQGLGVYMQTAAHGHAIVLVFAALTVTVVLTLVLLWLVFILERLLTPWQNIHE